MTKLPKNPELKEVISIKEILDYLIESWMFIFSMGAIGLLFAFGLIFIIPKSYEAKALIKVSQFQISQLESRNIESNGNLISRMSFPTSFTSENIINCGLKSSITPGEDILELFKIIQIKGVVDTIELKVTTDTKEKSINCAQSLYETIRENQQAIIKNNINVIKNYYQENENTIEILEKKSQEFSKDKDRINYLILNKEKIINLLGEGQQLKVLMNSESWSSAKLQSPIYASGKPVSPNKKLILIAGVLIGIFCGIFIIIIRNAKHIFYV